MQNEKKYPWYLKVIDFPGAIVFLMFLGMIYFYISLLGKRVSKKKDSSIRITVVMMPYVLAIAVSIIGYSTENELVLNLVRFITVFSILYLVINSFRFSHNPISFLDQFLLDKAQSPNRFTPEIVKEVILKIKDCDSLAIAPDKEYL